LAAGCRNPIIYIMDDLGDWTWRSRHSRHHRQLAAQGAAVLVISPDIDEIISMSDRFLVAPPDRQRLPSTATKED
jgi:ABC-type sugar transport system ATPase subunit